jgi:pimeloyl-ACP methyl ester carboxylesterase
MVSFFRGLFVLVVLLVIGGLLVVNFYGDPDMPDAVLVTKYAPTPPSQFITLPSGAHVHFRDQGVAGAPVLVLLHGSNASLHTWERWVQSLGTEFRIITVDLPSHGLTGAVPSNDYSQAGMANFVDEFTTALHVPRFAIGGNSMGGGVAARFTLMYPARVTKLILIDAGGGIAPKTPTDPGLGFRLARIPVVQNIMLYVTPRTLFEQGLRKAFYDKTLVTPEMVDRYWELSRRVGNRAATLKRFQTTPDSFVADHVSEIKVPTLIIWGDRDTLVPIDAGEAYRDAIKGSQFIVYRDVGHIPMEEVADRSAEAVRVFLEKP